MLKGAANNDFDIMILERLVPINIVRKYIKNSEKFQAEITAKEEQSFSLKSRKGAMSIFTENSYGKVDLIGMRETFTKIFQEVDTDKNGKKYKL